MSEAQIQGKRPVIVLQRENRRIRSPPAERMPAAPISSNGCGFLIFLTS